MKFEMLGDIVQLYKYEISYNDRDITLVDGCISTEHKVELEKKLTEQSIEFTTTEISQPQYEWLNGKEFEGGYDEALKASQMGEEAWNQYCFEHDENAQLKAKNEQLEIALAETLEKQEKDKTEMQLVIAQLIESGGVA